MLRRGDSPLFAARLLVLIFLITPSSYSRGFLPGLPGQKSSSLDEGWALYCVTCKHIGPRYTSEITKGTPCGSGHSATEVLYSYICQPCNKELLYTEMTAPRRAADIQCNEGTHTPKEMLAREPGTDSYEIQQA